MTEKSVADIRQSCSVMHIGIGSIMTAPRENNLVRFYIQLNNDEVLKEVTGNQDGILQLLFDIAQNILFPYKLTYRRCDWTSIYRVRDLIPTAGPC